MHLIDFTVTPILPAMSRPLISQQPGTAQALVAVLIDGETPAASASTALARWKLVNPLANWSVLDMRQAPPEPGEWLQRMLSELLARKHMQSGQLVLLGRRDAGRRALDLVLNGALACAGFVGIDIPCAPPRVATVPTTASIRLVLHEGDANQSGGDSLLGMLRRADIDTRIMRLPSTGADDEDTTVRAAGTFLFELVAKACRHAIQQGSHHV